MMEHRDLPLRSDPRGPIRPLNDHARHQSPVTSPAPYSPVASRTPPSRPRRRRGQAQVTAEQLDDHYRPAAHRPLRVPAAARGARAPRNCLSRANPTSIERNRRGRHDLRPMLAASCGTAIRRRHIPPLTGRPHGAWARPAVTVAADPEGRGRQVPTRCRPECCGAGWGPRPRPKTFAREAGAATREASAEGGLAAAAEADLPAGLKRPPALTAAEQPPPRPARELTRPDRLPA